MLPFEKELPINRNIFEMTPIHKNENEEHLNQI